MSVELICREDELAILAKLYRSDKAELLAIYGRRRVGKILIDKNYAEKLQKKVEVFRKITSTKKKIFIAMISANGIKKNKYSDELINGVVTLKDLFKEEL